MFIHIFIYCYVYICIYTYVYIYIYIITYVHIHTYLCIYVYIYIHEHTHQYTYFDTYLHLYTIHSFIHKQTHTHTRITYQLQRASLTNTTLLHTQALCSFEQSAWDSLGLFQKTSTQDTPKSPTTDTSSHAAMQGTHTHVLSPRPLPPQSTSQGDRLEEMRDIFVISHEYPQLPLAALAAGNIYMCECTYIYICVHIYINMYIYVYMYVNICISTYMYIYTYTYA